MSLTISNGATAMSGPHGTRTRMETTFARLASGRRVAAARDDAAGLAIGRRMEAAARGLAQGERNLATGIDHTATVEGTMQSSHDTLHRMRELSIQAANGTLTATDRATIQREFDELAATLDQTAPASGSTVFTDGNGGEVTVEVQDTSASGLGASGLAAGDPATLQALDRAIDTVSSARSSLGAVGNRMTFRAEMVSAMRVGLEASRSAIEDLDYATAISDLQRDRVVASMQLAGLQRVGRAERAALDLLG